jgi:integrase
MKNATVSKFTDTYIKKLKLPAGARDITLFEANTGLGVRKYASGRVVFHMQIKLAKGAPWRETIGAYGAFTIEAARGVVADRVNDVARGVDLYAQRNARRAQAESAIDAHAFTLEKLVDKWKDEHLVNRRASYGDRAAASIKNHFKPYLKRSAMALGPEEVEKAIRAIEGKGARKMAATSLRSAYLWALKKRLIPSNPTDGFDLPIKPAPRKRVLDAQELRRIWAASGRIAEPGSSFVRLLLLTGARRTEIGQLRWTEIVADDEGRQAIELKSARTKTGSGHRIPLSEAAQAVIRGISLVVGCPFVFTSDGRTALNNYARVKKALDDEIAEDGLGPMPGWVFHDFRRSAVTALAAEPFEYDPVTLDLLLGHAPGSLTPIARIYQQHKFTATRRKALADWAEHVMKAPAAP